MNVVIGNRYKENIKGLGIEIAGLLEGEFNSDEIISAFSNFYYEKIIIDVTSIKDYMNTANLIVNLKKMVTFLEPSKIILLLENIPEFNNSVFLSKIVNLNINNFTFDINEILTLITAPKTDEGVKKYAEFEEVKTKFIDNSKTRVIGIRNVTEHAGATSLIYMMYQELSSHYSVKAVELNKEDFKYFYNEDLISIKNEQLMDTLLIEPYPDVVLVDVNDYENELLIKETLHLIEPSVVKLNKLMDKSPNILTELSDKKVVLNKTCISMEKAKQFESESKLNVFDIIRNVNERETPNPQVMNLLIKLGFNKINNGIIIMDDTEKKKTLFDTFK